MTEVRPATDYPFELQRISHTDLARYSEDAVLRPGDILLVIRGDSRWVNRTVEKVQRKCLKIDRPEIPDEERVFYSRFTHAEMLGVHATGASQLPACDVDHSCIYSMQFGGMKRFGWKEEVGHFVLVRRPRNLPEHHDPATQLRLAANCSAALDWENRIPYGVGEALSYLLDWQILRSATLDVCSGRNVHWLRNHGYMWGEKPHEWYPALMAADRGYFESVMFVLVME